MKGIKRSDGRLDRHMTFCCSTLTLGLHSVCVLFFFFVENELEGQKKSLPLDGAIMDFLCTKSLWLFGLLEFDHRPFLGSSKTFF